HAAEPRARWHVALPRVRPCCLPSLRFFAHDPAPAAIYTLSLHDALPISPGPPSAGRPSGPPVSGPVPPEQPVRSGQKEPAAQERSEEHTSELQSRENLVCRLLLEKKKKTTKRVPTRPTRAGQA